MKKIIALVLVCLTLMSVLTVTATANDITNLIRFVPAKMTVTSSVITVEGYFVNMNTNLGVNYFTNFELILYHDGKKVFEANFNDQKIDCSVSSGRIRKHTFNITMNGGHSADLGTYTCDQSYYCEWYGTLNYSWN